MGGIRKPKKKYVVPGHPWQKTRLAEELTFIGEYGLRNKRELWRHRTMLARFRGTARDLVALPSEVRSLQESQLLGRLINLALLADHSALDAVLNLTMRDLLERRLQTQVLRQGLAKTMHHARQLITHGHIVLGEHRVTSPGMLLFRDQERQLAYSRDSPYRHPSHPEIPKGEVAAPAPPTEPEEQPETVEIKIPQVRDIREVSLGEEEIEAEEEPEAEEENEEAEAEGKTEGKNK